MRILQLCNKVPFPEHDGGAIAVLNLSRALISGGHSVSVMAMNTSRHYVDLKSIPEDLSKSISFTAVPVDTKIKPLKLILNFFFSSLPYNAIRFNSPAFSEALKQKLKNENFDIIQLEGLYLKPYIPLIRQFHKGIIVYRAHNVESEIWYKLTSSARNFFKKIYLNNLAKRIEIYERDMLNQYDLLLTITEPDLISHRQLGNNKPAFVIPTGIPSENFHESYKPENNNNLFFIGSLDWMPNQDGLSWFIDKVWKLLKNHESSPVFHVAGRNAPDWLSRKCIENGINFHGEVENAHHFMDNHGFMIVPLFAGSGLRIKIIEAISRSCAVISTPVGAQGTGLTDGKNIIIAEKDDFYKAISQLLLNPQKIQEIKKNAYLFAIENYSNNAILKMLLAAYDR